MVFLMYHELETDGRPLCNSAAGYVRYVVRASDFRKQMTHLKSTHRRGVDVDKALEFDGSEIAVTFDDGAATDLLTAAPILSELGFGATFYITVGFVGRRGYLTKDQLVELSSLGFQIGCHSMTHAYLTDLGEADLHKEIVDAKKELEQLVGKSVEHFSCPGGRFDDRSTQMVRDANYKTMATSRLHVNLKNTSKYSLGRIPIKRETTLRDFRFYTEGRGLWTSRLRESVGRGAQQLLGNKLYDRLR